MSGDLSMSVKLIERSAQLTATHNTVVYDLSVSPSFSQAMIQSINSNFTQQTRQAITAVGKRLASAQILERLKVC